MTKIIDYIGDVVVAVGILALVLGALQCASASPAGAKKQPFPARHLGELEPGVDVYESRPSIPCVFTVSDGPMGSRTGSASCF